jgi:hypothetical protein
VREKYLTDSFKFVKDFKCLQDKCPNSCCKGWDMQIDDKTISKYLNHPDLANIVNIEEKILKRANDDYCFKASAGLCLVHEKYGEDYLGDACYFYPRIIRKIQDQYIVSASMSCPEITRLILFEENIFDLSKDYLPRIPQQIKSYDDLSAEHVSYIQKKIINMIMDKEKNAEQVMLQLLSMSRSFQFTNKQTWFEAIDFIVDNNINIDARNTDDSNPYKLLHSLILIARNVKGHDGNILLKNIIDKMQTTLNCKFDENNLDIICYDEEHHSYNNSLQQYQNNKDYYDKILKRYLAAQILVSFFPFSNNPYEVMKIIAVKFATIRLTYICYLDMEKIVEITHVLSRLFDHLANNQFAIAIYNNYGWQTENEIADMIDCC